MFPAVNILRMKNLIDALILPKKFFSCQRDDMYV